MGRFVLVLSEILRSAQRPAVRGRGGGEILDGRRQTWRSRSLRRRYRARRPASALRPILAQSVFRPRLLLETRTFPAPRDPRNHYRRRQPDDVETESENCYPD